MSFKVDNLKHSRYMDQYDYKNIRSLRNAYGSIQKMEQKAMYQGNDGAATIIVDLKMALEGKNKVLTEKQLEAIRMVLIDDVTETEAAEILNVSQQALHYRIKAGLKRIRKFLLTGEIIESPPNFTEEQNIRLKELYAKGLSDPDIATILSMPIGRVRNKIRYWRKKKVINRRRGQ